MVAPNGIHHDGRRLFFGGGDGLLRRVDAAGAVTTVADLGAEEVAEGLVRAAASEAMAERSDELAAAGAGLAARGIFEMGVAEGAAEVAADRAEESLAGAMVGGAELGAAATMDAVAEALEEEE